MSIVDNIGLSYFYTKIRSVFVLKTGDTLTGTLKLKPSSGEGGQLELHASTAQTTQSGVVLDQQNSNLRIFGIASADGSTHTGVGETLSINPYDGTILGGGYAINVGKVFNAIYNDYAEFFPRGEKTEAGDIICLDVSSNEERYVRSRQGLPVVGVHTEEFAHLIGGQQVKDDDDYYNINIKNYIPVSLAGRVTVKIKGKAKKGQYVVPSDTVGVGMASDDATNSVGILLEEDNLTKERKLKILVK